MAGPSGLDGALLLGAVAYDAKVVTIWEGFRQWFRQHGFELDYVLYSNYERQVEDLVGGRLQMAWNSPLAWVRARRLAAAQGRAVRPIAMRDTDCDLRSVVVTRSDSTIETVTDLKGKVVATGAVDSPQATLLPLALLRASGLEPDHDFEVARFDVGVGLHGDHVGGERDAARALAAGEADAACMIDANHLLFAREGTLTRGSTRVLAQTDRYDHCNMTVGPDAPESLVDRLAELLMAMSYEDDQIRPLLDLEGLKQWREGRTAGYAQLEAAVDQMGFYDDEGRVLAGDYRP